MKLYNSKVNQDANHDIGINDQQCLNIFFQERLKNSIRFGTRQYLKFFFDYDISISNKNIKIYELSTSEIIGTKKENGLTSNNIKYIGCDLTTGNWIDKLKKEGYQENIRSFSSLLGISSNLTKLEFIKLLKQISNNISIGSEIVFDYKLKNKSNDISKISSNKEKKTEYSYYEMEYMLDEAGFLIYELIDNKSFNKNHKMYLSDGLQCCLAVKNQ